MEITLRRMFKNDDAAMVLHVYFISGVVGALQEGHRRRPIATEADNGGESCVANRFVCYLLNGAMAAFLSSRARSSAMTPSSSAREVRASKVSDPTVATETSKIARFPESRSKYDTSAVVVQQ